jgi:hypothetical protein
VENTKGSPFLESKNENTGIRIAAMRKKLATEVVVLSLLGPVGIVRLAIRRAIDKWQLVGLLCVWLTVFWCRWITGISIPSIFYETFIIGFLVYSSIICYPFESEVDKTTIVIVTLVLFMIAVTGYVELCVARHVKNFNSPIDFFVVSAGFVGYEIASYRALRKKSDVT